MALACVPLVALGLGRFGYGLLLPSMRDALGWSYADSGVVATANSVGYLAGALCAPPVIRRVGLGPSVSIGSALTALTIGLTAIDGGIGWAGTMRFGSGYFGGLAFVGGGVMATQLRERGVPHALTAYPAGAGAGIALSVVSLDGLLRANRWQASWIVLGGFAALASLAVRWVAHRAIEPETTVHPDGRPTRLPRTLFVAYGLYGLGYITFATFAIAYLRDRGMSADGRGKFWLIVGLAAVVAAAVWPRVLDRLWAGLPLAAPMLLVAVSVGVLLLSQGAPAAYVSAGLFGFAFLAAISGVATIARRDLPPESWSTALAVLTTWFAVGQSAGPVLAGLVGDSTDGLGTALIGSICALVVGAVVAAMGTRRITIRKGNP